MDQPTLPSTPIPPDTPTNRTSFLQRAASWLDTDLMARVTRSSKRVETTPTATPSKAAAAKADPDTPIASVEVPAKNKDSNGPYARKPRKRRQRDIQYKKKKRAQGFELQREKVNKLKLPEPEHEALRAGIGSQTASQKLSSLVLEQRAEIDRLRKQLNGGSKTSEEKAAFTHNDSAPGGSGRRQRKPIS